MNKKILTLLCCLALALALFFIAAPAARADIGAGVSGSCNWAINDSGVLTISPADGVSGTLDGPSGSSWPWYTYRNNIKEVKFEGTVKSSDSTAYMFNNLQYLTKIDFTGFDMSASKSMFCMFTGCNHLDSLDVSSLNTSNVETLYQAFSNCSSLGSLDLHSWNTAKVTNMQSTFSGCAALASLNLNGWNTAAVKTMNGMFSGCHALTTLDLRGFDCRNVTNFSYTFQNCALLNSVTLPNGFVSENAQTMFAMFYGCESLPSLSTAGWDTKNVTNMAEAFYLCKKLKNLDVSSWDTGKVQQMYRMFAECLALESLDVKNWKTGNVLSMTSMFNYCAVLKAPAVQNWDLSSCTSLNYMFASCNAITSLDLSAWGGKLGKVVSMNHMFSNCSSLKSINVSNWDTSNVQTVAYIFAYCPVLEELDLSGWSSAGLNDTHSWYSGAANMFDSTFHLKKIIFGDNFSLSKNGTLSYKGILPTHKSKINGTGWTGNWVRVEDGAVKSVDEIRMLNTGELTGTWVWEGQITFTKIDKDTSRVMPNVKFILNGSEYITDSRGQFVVDGLYEANGATLTLTETTPTGYKEQPPITLRIATEYYTTTATPYDGWLLTVSLDNGTEVTQGGNIPNEQLKYSVAYDANGGSGTVPTDTTQYLKNATVTVKPGTELTRDKHQFKNWNTKADGSGMPYNAGQTFQIQADTTLYAQWDETVTVTFDAQGGTPAPAAQTFVKGGQATRPSTDPSWADMVFVHWYLNDADKAYNFSSAVNTDIRLTAKYRPWAEGSISATVKIINADTYRNEMQYGANASIAWLRISHFGNRTITLLDKDKKPISSITSPDGTFSFTGLEAGTYYLRLDSLNTNVFWPLRGIVNGNAPMNVETDQVSVPLVIDRTNTTASAYWVLEYRAYGLKLTTEIGTFPEPASPMKGHSGNGTLVHPSGAFQDEPNSNLKDKVYFEGWNGYIDISSQVQTNPYLNTHNGIYYGDTIGLYTKQLETPTLSAEELAYGYEFLGWHVQGTPNDEVLTAEDALALAVRSDIVLEARFTYPKHTVAFVTDTQKGALGGQSVFTLDGNTSTMAGKGYALPSVTPQSGYRFVGWYTDPGTTNVISGSTILNSAVTQDITYYAKYEPRYTVTYSDGAGGSVFADKVNGGLLYGDATPSFGTDPTRENYVFKGWSPAVQPTVTDHIVYFATWAPLTESSTYTVIYTDDVGRTAFADQVHTGLAAGADTPAFAGVPTREGYVFVGWNPKVSPTVQGDAVYFAAWRPADAGADHVHTVIFDPTEKGSLEGRGTHQVPAEEYVPMIPGVEAKEGFRFLEKWKVTDITGDAKGFVQVGDVLNETNISHLRIRYDITLQALYDQEAAATAAPTAAPTEAPTAAPTAQPTPAPTAAPTATPGTNDFYFAFTKEWQGEAGQDISFTLYNANGSVRPHKFNRRQISEKVWVYECWLSSAGDYYVIEDKTPGYRTTYVNKGAHADVKDRCYNGGTIINASTPKTGDRNRPEIWLGLLGISAAGLGTAAFLLKKGKKKADASSERSKRSKR